MAKKAVLSAACIGMAASTANKFNAEQREQIQKMLVSVDLC